MSQDPKYIRFNNGVNDVVLVFPAFIDHAAMASLHAGVGGVESAGFVSFRTSPPECYGHSQSLKLSSAPETDSSLLQQMLNLNGDV